MSNSYSPPKLEKRANTVAKQTADREVADMVIGVASQPQPTDAASIYITNISAFVKFLRGEEGSGTPDERRRYQLRFLDSIWAMLRLEDPQVKRILDHFLITIGENPDVFEYNNVLRPLYSCENERPAQDVTKYKRFMLFMITLSAHARDRQRFLKQFDMTKFSNMFDPITKQRLTNYVYR